MAPRFAKLCLSLWLTLGTLAWAAGEAPARSKLLNPEQWVVEQLPGGRVVFSDGLLRIEDKQGCTVWYRHRLASPVVIRFRASIRGEGRVSDLNCFWMASDPRHPADLFHEGHRRTGAFATYDTLQTYYVGYGGNSNSTTRFRRYAGGGAKPLLPEHDLRHAGVLLEANRVYEIEIRVADGVTEYIRDKETIFSFKDPNPLTEGWFGFRTVDAIYEVSAFEVVTPDSPSRVTGR